MSDLLEKCTQQNQTAKKPKETKEKNSTSKTQQGLLFSVTQNKQWEYKDNYSG